MCVCQGAHGLRAASSLRGGVKLHQPHTVFPEKVWELETGLTHYFSFPVDAFMMAYGPDVWLEM